MNCPHPRPADPSPDLLESKDPALIGLDWIGLDLFHIFIGVQMLYNVVLVSTLAMILNNPIKNFTSETW